MIDMETALLIAVAAIVIYGVCIVSTVAAAHRIEPKEQPPERDPDQLTKE